MNDKLYLCYLSCPYVIQEYNTVLKSHLHGCGLRTDILPKDVAEKCPKKGKIKEADDLFDKKN